MADDRGRGVNEYIAKAKAKAKATLHEEAPKLTKLELAFRQKFIRQLNDQHKQEYHKEDIRWLIR